MPLKFIELNKTFTEALRFKYEYDAEAKKRNSKYKSTITRQKWMNEDDSIARVTFHSNLSVNISRVSKQGRRKDNSLKIEDYLATDWMLIF